MRTWMWVMVTIGAGLTGFVVGFAAPAMLARFDDATAGAAETMTERPVRFQRVL